VVGGGLNNEEKEHVSESRLCKSQKNLSRVPQNMSATSDKWRETELALLKELHPCPCMKSRIPTATARRCPINKGLWSDNDEIKTSTSGVTKKHYIFVPALYLVQMGPKNRGVFSRRNHHLKSYAYLSGMI